MLEQVQGALPRRADVAGVGQPLERPPSANLELQLGRERSVQAQVHAETLLGLGPEPLQVVVPGDVPEHRIEPGDAQPWVDPRPHIEGTARKGRGAAAQGRVERLAVDLEHEGVRRDVNVVGDANAKRLDAGAGVQLDGDAAALTTACRTDCGPANTTLPSRR